MPPTARSSRRKKNGKQSIFSSAIWGSLLAVAGLALAVASVVAFVKPEWAAEPGTLEVISLTIERLPGEDEPFVTALLKNPSRGLVKTVSLSAEVAGAEIILSGSKTPIIANSSGAIVAPGGEQKIAVAPVSEFLSLFKSKCPGCFFLGSGLVQQMPENVRADICRDLAERGLMCKTQYGIYPIVFVAEFSAGRAGRTSKRQFVFAYLSKATKSDYVVPRH